MKVFTLPLGALQTNCHVLASDGKAIIVDPADQCSKILAFLKKEVLSLEGVVLTHCHFDHMLSYKDWQDFANIPSAAMAEETEGLLSPSVNLNEMFYREQISYGAPEIQLEDNQILTFGNHTIKVIATPGHTVGSCCYLIDDALFSGDTVFASGNYGRFDFPTGDASALFASIKKLCALDDHITVYPGHGDKEKMKNIKSVFG